MGTVALRPLYLCPHAIFLAEDRNRVLPFQQLPSQRVFGLVTDEQHDVTGIPDVVLQVVQNASSLAHP